MAIIQTRGPQSQDLIGQSACPAVSLSTATWREEWPRVHGVGFIVRVIPRSHFRNDIIQCFPVPHRSWASMLVHYMFLMDLQHWP